MAFDITIKTLSNLHKFNMQLSNTDKLKDIKAKISVLFGTAMPPKIQTLVHRGNILQTDQTAQEMGIHRKHFLVLLVQPKYVYNLHTNQEESDDKKQDNIDWQHLSQLIENKIKNRFYMQNIAKAITMSKTLTLRIRKHWKFKSSKSIDCKIKLNLDHTVADIKTKIIKELKLPIAEIQEINVSYGYSVALLDEQILTECDIKDNDSLFITVVYRKFPIYVHVVAMLDNAFRNTLQVETTVNETIQDIRREIVSQLELHQGADFILCQQHNDEKLDVRKTCLEYKVQDNDILHCKHAALPNAIAMIDAVTQWIAGCLDVMQYDITKACVLEPIARTILCGVYDDSNIWSNLRGMRYIVKAIWELVGSTKVNYWKKWIKTDQIYAKCTRERVIYNDSETHFPKPRGININMMPFIMSRSFKESKLPLYVESYWRMIEQCIACDRTQEHKIGYLTVQESLMQKGRTQRRGGLHTESPGTIDIFKGDGHNVSQRYRVGWGGGYSTYYVQRDGLYIASNVDDSCAIWNCKIVRNEETGAEIIGKLGDIEHLRKNVNRLANKIVTKAGLIYWICDRTPHEALPLDDDVCRQFFRVVSHKVSIWYQVHNTPNPNGVVPDAEITQIVKGNKFGVRFDHHVC